MSSQEVSQNVEDDLVPVNMRWPRRVCEVFDTNCKANGTNRTRKTLELVVHYLAENSVQKLKSERESHKNMGFLVRQKKDLLASRDDLLLLIEGIRADTKAERNKHPEILERQGPIYRKFATLYERAGGSWKPPLKVEELKAELRKLVQEESQNPENRRLPERFDSFLNFLHVENQLHALWSQTVMVGSTIEEEKPPERPEEVGGTAFSEFTEEREGKVVFEKKTETPQPTPVVKAKKDDPFFDYVAEWGQQSK